MEALSSPVEARKSSMACTGPFVEMVGRRRNRVSPGMTKQRDRARHVRCRRHEHERLFAEPCAQVSSLVRGVERSTVRHDVFVRHTPRARHACEQIGVRCRMPRTARQEQAGTGQLAVKAHALGQSRKRRPRKEIARGYTVVVRVAGTEHDDPMWLPSHRGNGCIELFARIERRISIFERPQ